MTAGTAPHDDDGFWSAVENGDAATLADRLGVPANTLADLLPALAAWRDRGRDQSLIDGWRYRITWKPANVAAAAAAAVPAAGAAAASVTTPTANVPVGKALTGTWIIADPDRFALTEVLAGLGADVVNVPVHDITAQTVGREIAGILAMPVSATDALPLVQTVIALGTPAPLWLVTRGAIATGRSDTADPEAATVWGLGRVLALEHPDRRGGLLDLPTTAVPQPTTAPEGTATARPGELEAPAEGRLGELDGRPESTSDGLGAHAEGRSGVLDARAVRGPAGLDARAAGRLAAVLGGELGDEDQIALRPAGVLVRRLVHAPAPSHVPAGAGVAWQPAGTVLITGGTGGLGAEVARWAAAHGAQRLVLVSRRGAGAPGVAELLAELPTAEVHACDLADRSEVAALLAAVGPVDAVVHAAGVSEDMALVDIDAEHLDRVVRGKVDGAIHLDELIGDVDAFIVFSSISAVWGSGRQAAYGAANAALDALVRRRRAAGRPGISIAWGPWARVGMAADPEAATALRRQGLVALDPATAITALALAVGADKGPGGGDGLVTIADVRWNEFLPLFTAARPRPLLSDLPEAGVVPIPAPAGGSA
ncbi:beta-ketoacyl reductase, partial [Actinoplanes derwentensis]|uniref:beta-ketoacyl reductase n=1 Tax=Actinoplanes derwentensis TaxID=113562 RepID=UPI00194502E7